MSDKPLGARERVMDLDIDKLIADLRLARENHDWGDVAEIIEALANPGSFGLDYRAESQGSES